MNQLLVMLLIWRLDYISSYLITRLTRCVCVCVFVLSVPGTAFTVVSSDNGEN